MLPSGMIAYCILILALLLLFSRQSAGLVRHDRGLPAAGSSASRDTALQPLKCDDQLVIAYIGLLVLKDMASLS